MTKLLIPFFLVAGAALAQPFSLGVKAGLPLTDAFNAASNQTFNFRTTTDRYIIGPTAEIHLPFGIGFEVDALYRRFHYTGTSAIVNGTALTSVTSVDSGDWEFPVLAKYRFPSKVVRPYVDGGIAWNKLAGLTQSVSQSVSNGRPTVVNKNTATGIVFGAGLDIHFVIHLLPEIRYTHWNSDQIVDPTGFLRSSRNQGEFLLGITF